MAGLAGKAAGLRIGGVEYPVTSWELNGDAEVLDDSNSKSSGHFEGVAGFDECDVSFEGHHDLSSSPVDYCYPGASVTLRLYVSASLYQDVTCIVDKFSIKAAIKGQVDFSCTAKGTGVDLATIIAAFNS